MLYPIQSLAKDRVIPNIEYAVVQGQSLQLDLYLPAQNISQPPLLVYVHGGAWRSGSRANPPILPLVDHGFAVASVDYRLTPTAPFPANVHDIKAAIRFLRARADDWGYHSQKMIIVGSSAGGHLAALVGVTNGHPDLEGDVGQHKGQSSHVQGIVSFYGASNLESILRQSTEHGLKVRIPALQLLLKGQPEERPELARLASPVFHVDANDPPLFLIHGAADEQMPWEQSRELENAYLQNKLPVQLTILPQGQHGGAEFYDTQQLTKIAEFLKNQRISPKSD